jgi:Uma2 family endonuclease
MFYQKLPSLNDYVFVAQDRMRVEHFSPQAGDQWLLSTLDQADAVLLLTSIQVRLPLTDLYDKVRLPDAGDGEV